MNLPNKKQILESLDSHILGRYGLGKWRKKVFFSTLKNFIPLLKSLIKNSVSKHGIRDLTFVNRAYTNIYDPSNEDWIESRVSRQELFRMGKQSLNVNGWFLMKYFCKIYEHVIKETKSLDVLEVGSGRGNNAVILALNNPNVHITGLEYVDSGVKRSREMLNNPPIFLDSSLDSHIDSSKRVSLIERVNFIQGNAFEMPFDDKSFDLTYTSLVFEQMPHKYVDALKEINRVTKNYVVFIEPFKEANNTLGKAKLKSMDYFRYSYKSFQKFGFEPIAFINDIPQKLHFGTAALIAKIIRP